MKRRNLAAVFLLPFITFGIYGLVWQVKTKNEMNRLGATIPTAWLIIIPFVNIYWLWKYCEGVEKVTNGKMSGVMAFVLLFILGVIGMTIVQSEFNKLDSAPQTSGMAGAPLTPAGSPSPVQPDNSFGGPIQPAGFQTQTPVQPAVPSTESVVATPPSPGDETTTPPQQPIA